MLDTGKTVRVPRTQFGGGLAQAGTPTERSQLVAQEVHQYRDTESDALYALNDAIARFAGAGANALTSVQEGYQRGKLAEIDEQNAAQKRQALGDALSGKEMDADLENDRDYYDAFRSVKAQRDGFDAAQDFTSWYLQEWLPDNPMGDLAEARQQWANENLTGSDDPDYEGQLIASFFDRTDGLLPEHMKAAIKYQTDKGMEALGSLVEADVASGSVTVEKLNDYFNKARTLDPMNAAEAPTRVVNALLAAAANHPDKMMGVSNLLSQPGTGVNGKSFAQSFPDAYAGFQQSAVSAYNEINSTKELDAYTSLTDRVREAKTADDIKSITVDALKFRQQYGAPGKVDALLGQLDTALTHIGKNLDLANSTMKWIGGDHSADPADVKKGFPLLLEQMGLKTILDAEPKQAAEIIGGLAGVVPDEVSSVLTASMLDTRSPANQAKAYETLSILSRQVGKEAATAYLSTAAKNMFDHAYALSAVTDEPIDQLLGRVNEARDKVKDWSVDWQTITGDSDAKTAGKRVKDLVDSELLRLLGKDALLPWDKRSAILPPTLSTTVMDVARMKAIEMAQSGLGWEAGVRAAVQQVAADAEGLPGRDGTLTVMLDATRQGRYVGDDGTVAQRPRMGISVINPTTGKPVDTVQVFSDQVKQAAQDMPALFPSGRADQVFLGVPFNPSMRERGLLDVRGPDNRPLLFAAGTKMKVMPSDAPSDPGAIGRWVDIKPGASTSREFTIPSTAAEMDQLFDLPEGFKFVRIDTPHGVVWQLGYRPNFGTETGKTLDERADDFVAPDISDNNTGIRELMTGGKPDPLWSAN